MAFRQDRGRFDRGSSRGSGRFGDRGGGRFGGRDSRTREMFDVTCAKCGKECRVPFKPTGDKPVLCSDCFRQNGDSGRSQFNSGSGMSSDQVNQINAKLDKIIRVLEQLEIIQDEDSEDEYEGEDDSDDSEKL